MPYDAPKILLELIDFDKGDDEWEESWEEYRQTLYSRMEQFEFIDHDVKRDRCKIGFRNDDYILMDNPVFTKGQKFLVSWGWPGAMAPPRRMVVTKVTGGVSLTVTLLDTSILLDRQKRGRYYAQTTDSEFVRDVAKEHGYEGATAHIEETSVRHDITQPQWRTDARQIAQMARKNGFVFYIDATGLHWHRRQNHGEAVRTFYYRTDRLQGTIIDQPEIEGNLTRGVSSVRVLARDPRSKIDIDFTVSASNTEDMSLGRELEDGDPQAANPGKRAKRITRSDVRVHGYMTREEAEAIAHARYRDSAQQRYKLSFSIIGDAQLGGKNLIEIYGLSDTIDGLYYVKSIKHNIAAGSFTSLLQCRKDAQREVKATKKIERLAKANPRVDLDVVSEAMAGIEEQGKLKRRATLRYSKNGEPQVAWYYVDSEDQQVSPAATMTVDELLALSEREKESIARESGQTQLPDD